MKVEDLKVGMRVKISEDADTTFRRFGSSPGMYKMLGKIYPIREVKHIKKAVMISSYIWDIDNLELMKPIKKIKAQLFDPTGLDI